jgi:hypothetical protein
VPADLRGVRVRVVAFERRGEREVRLAPLPGDEATHDRRADPIVVALDQTFLLRVARADQVLGPQARQRVEQILAGSGGAGDELELERPRRDRDELEHRARRAVELRHALLHDRVQAIRRAELAIDARELVDEERIAVRLGGDRIRPALVGRSEQRRGELRRLCGSERFEPQLVDRHVGEQRREPREERARGPLLVAKPCQPEHRRRIRSAHELGEQRRAVGIAPLQIVDAHDHRRSRGEPLEQRAQRRDPADPHVGRIAARVAQRRDARDLQQHRKQRRQRHGVARQQRGRFVRRHPAEPPRQLVDDRVERLVRDGLELEAASGEHHRVGPPPPHVVEETPQERGLADARRAERERHRAAAARRLVEPSRERLLLGLSPHEDFATGGDLGRDLRRARPREDLITARPPLGIAREERGAQLVEIGRNVRERARARRVVALLRAHHVGELAGERQASGERLEQHQAHRVPIARLAEPFARALLRRHVERRARRIVVLDADLRRQSEVEQDDAAVGLDQDVRRLHVAVKPAVAVKRDEPLPQPAEQLARAVRAPLHVADRRLAAHQLHREERGVVVGDELVQLDEVRMAQLGEVAELALEPRQALRVRATQDLERDRRRAARAVIEDLVHRAETAAPEVAHDLEALGAGEQRVGSRRRRRGAQDAVDGRLVARRALPAPHTTYRT